MDNEDKSYNFWLELALFCKIVLSAAGLRLPVSSGNGCKHALAHHANGKLSLV